MKDTPWSEKGRQDGQSNGRKNESDKLRAVLDAFKRLLAEEIVLHAGQKLFYISPAEREMLAALPPVDLEKFKREFAKDFREDIPGPVAGIVQIAVAVDSNSNLQVCAGSDGAFNAVVFGLATLLALKGIHAGDAGQGGKNGSGAETRENGGEE